MTGDSKLGSFSFALYTLISPLFPISPDHPMLYLLSYDLPYFAPV